MHHQLRHLLHLSDQPRIAIHLIPTRTATPRTCTPFRLYEFTHQRPAVCLTHLNSTLILEDDTTVSTYRHLLHHLTDTAMNTPISRTRLTDLHLATQPDDHPITTTPTFTAPPPSPPNPTAWDTLFNIPPKSPPSTPEPQNPPLWSRCSGR